MSRVCGESAGVNPDSTTYALGDSFNLFHLSSSGLPLG